MALSVHSQAQNGNCEVVEEIDVFHQFDVVSDESDHYFLLNSKPKTKSGQPDDCFANASSGVHRKIMQEWRILEKNLPESIIVRVYEKRIDLLRAAIVGAAGTPYHDGLFFFDLAFPPDYPSRPPLVHYRSFGLRINPNLYANGRVCLSLINTWSGRKSEKWNPKESTVLQVLVSVQALVLNEKPYYNEPGHGIWPGKTIWEKRSAAYNEDVFVLSCKTMLFLMKKPPKNFEGFVVGHFRQRGSSILLACKSYADGRVKVGYFKNDGGSSSASGAGTLLHFSPVSEKFRGYLKQLYPQLAAAFSNAGASLGDNISMEEFNVVEKKKMKKKNKTASAKKRVTDQLRAVRSTPGVARRMFGKLKKVFGLKLGGNRSNMKN